MSNAYQCDFCGDLFPGAPYKFARGEQQEVHAGRDVYQNRLWAHISANVTTAKRSSLVVEYGAEPQLCKGCTLHLLQSVLNKELE